MALPKAHGSIVEVSGLLDAVHFHASGSAPFKDLDQVSARSVTAKYVAQIQYSLSTSLPNR